MSDKVPFLSLKRIFALLFTLVVVCIVVLFYTADYFYYPSIELISGTHAPLSATVRSTMQVKKSGNTDIPHSLLVNVLSKHSIRDKLKSKRIPGKYIDENEIIQDSEQMLKKDLFKTARNMKRNNNPDQLNVLNMFNKRPKPKKIFGRSESSKSAAARYRETFVHPTAFVKKVKKSNKPVWMPKKPDQPVWKRKNHHSFDTVSKNVDKPIRIPKKPYERVWKSIKFDSTVRITTTPAPSVRLPITHGPLSKRVSSVQIPAKPALAVQIPAEPARPTPRPRFCHGCMQHNFPIILQPPACDPLRSPTILFAVISSPNKLNERNAIRETWGKYNPYNVKLIFLFGSPKDPSFFQKLKIESETHSDILQEDFIDSYGNLTYKTMMAFKWVKVNCPNTQYVFKTDDDMWVNVPAFIRRVRTIDMEDKVGGMCILNAGPIRDTHSKWYASMMQYPQSKYPGFCSGTGYFMTGKTAIKLFNLSPDIPFFYLEDVYVSLLADRAGVKLQPVEGFNNYRVQPGDWCGYKRSLITSHGVSASEIRMLGQKRC